MKIISKKEFYDDRESYLKSIIKGAVFIYPTDTIYGIGCNARNRRAVGKIRKLKKRILNPFSVIAPSKKWIIENCVAGKEEKRWLRKLPGPYTLILRQKSRKCVAKNVNPGSSLIGVRIPKNWSSDITKKAGVPIITTSVNEAGREFMKSANDVAPDITKGVDFMIYEGEKEARPSTIVDLSSGKPIIKKR